MRNSVWRIAPLLLLAFFLFLASSTAQTAQKDVTDTPSSDSKSAHESRWHGSSRQTTKQDEEQSSEMAETVKEATALLRKVKAPTASKLARLTSKPKGVFGTSIYYAKEAFVLLFMNQPKQSNLLTTSTSQSQKLAPPLSRAVKLLKEAASHNDPDALYLLATLNFHGNYTHPISYPQAFTYYHRLASLTGNSTAQSMLGFLYATGLASPEVPADQAKSMLYHTFAAEQDDTRSQMTLAYRHHAGIATGKNCDEAVHWYKRVADKAILYYRSGPPGGHVLARDSYRLADEVGGVYGEGASVTSVGPNAKSSSGVTSDAYADIQDVLEYLHLQSSKGELKSTFSLARLHYDGARGLKRDLKVAKQHFLQVAREYWSESGKTRKDVSASTEKLASKAAGYLGRMFLRGEGMEQSFPKARIWFTRGLTHGDALSQYSLGLMNLHGLGVDVNVARAADLFAAAADQDLAVAQTELGQLFLDSGDPKTASMYFELAARNSHIEAFYYLAEMNNQAIGRDRSCGMAAVYYKIVVEKAEQIWGSIAEANEAYEDGDTQKALVNYLQAAEQGSENAQANVAWILDHTTPKWSPVNYLTSIGQSAKGAVGDAALALVYWTRSAKQQNTDSLVKMGDYYLSGLGTYNSVPSAENAAACYQAAEGYHSAQAMWNLGWMHENGLGLAQDFHLAKRYYDQALETNREAEWPVKLSLFKLRWRSWWNDVTHGGVKSMGDGDENVKKRRTFAEWINDFLEADAQMTAAEWEADDWGSDQDQMPGGDDLWGGEGGDLDDGLVETLIIGGLVAALGWLIYYRQQQQRAAEARRRLQVEAQAGGQAQGQQGAHHDGQQQGGVGGVGAPGQQPDGGFFPQPGDPNWNAWVAGGVGH